MGQSVQADVQNKTGMQGVINGFLWARVGHKVAKTVVDATTDDYTFTNSGTTVAVIRVIYDDATKAAVTSAERTA
jgi:hypothetical protein